MEGIEEIDKLMLPVLSAIKKHVRDKDGITEIYNRAYEAIMMSIQVNEKRITELELALKEANDRLANAGYSGTLSEMVDAVLKPRWIPVEERLPEMTSYGYRYSDRLLVMNGDEIIVASYCKHLNSWGNIHMELKKVTHWMPLPEPPEVE